VVEVDFISVGGLSLMERMLGYEQVILIDAMTGQDKPLGTLSIAALGDLPNNSQGRLCSAHDVSLQNALEVGKLSGAQIPEQITVIGIEAQAVYDFSDQLSPIIEQVVPEAAQCVINLINKEI
jgi:hydrogenase maturation protease